MLSDTEDEQGVKVATGRASGALLTPGIILGDDAWAERVDDYLEGFGDR